MSTVQMFKAARKTHRWNLNQRAWIRHAYANRLEVFFKWRGSGRYVAGQVDRFAKSVGEIVPFDVARDFADRITGRQA